MFIYPHNQDFLFVFLLLFNIIYEMNFHGIYTYISFFVRKSCLVFCLSGKITKSWWGRVIRGSLLNVGSRLGLFLSKASREFERSPGRIRELIRCTQCFHFSSCCWTKCEATKKVKIWKWICQKQLDIFKICGELNLVKYEIWSLRK